MLGLCFVMQYCLLSRFAIISLGKRELVALLLLCSDVMSLLSLLRGAMGWSVVCDCGISWSCLLAFLANHHLGFRLLIK